MIDRATMAAAAVEPSVESTDFATISLFDCIAIIGYVMVYGNAIICYVVVRSF